MIRIGRFAILGDWDDTPTPEHYVRIVMPPLGHVHGAGWLPQTKAALAEIEARVTPGMSFAEIGAGSCILLVAAAKLGAGPCFATEINPDALAAGQRVLAANPDAPVTLIKGTAIPEPVDLAIISIGSSVSPSIVPLIQARTILVIEDDATVTEYGGQ